MKIAKDVFLDFLNKASIKGINNDIVIELDGTVTKSAENSLFIVGQTKQLIFSERVAINNLGLIAKIVGDISAALISVELVDKKLHIFTADNDTKYAFRMSDPAVVESLKDDRETILGLTKGLKSATVDGTIIKKIRTAITSLVGTSASDEKNRISIFVENEVLYAVVIHEGTDSMASIEVCKFKEKDFKLSFQARTFSKILEVVGDSSVTIYAGPESALFFELLSKDFMYSLSYIEEKPKE